VAFLQAREARSVASFTVQRQLVEEGLHHLRPTYVSMSVMEEHINETMVQRDSSTSESSSYAPQPETEASLVLKATANSYPFLVHSTDTLANNRPPNVDNKPLARQKRRRTR
jgi:hypothetical protein